MIGIASFICGCLSLILWWIPLFGLVPPVAGTVLGGLGLRRARRAERAGRPADQGLAIAGLVLSIMALVPAMFLLVVFIAAALSGAGDAAAVAPPADTTLL